MNPQEQEHAAAIADMLYTDVRQQYDVGSSVPVVELMGLAKDSIGLLEEAVCTAPQVLSQLEAQGCVERRKREYIVLDH